MTREHLEQKLTQAQQAYNRALSELANKQAEVQNLAGAIAAYEGLIAEIAEQAGDDDVERTRTTE